MVICILLKETALINGSKMLCTNKSCCWIRVVAVLNRFTTKMAIFRLAHVMIPYFKNSRNLFCYPNLTFLRIFHFSQIRIFTPTGGMVFLFDWFKIRIWQSSSKSLRTLLKEIHPVSSHPILEHYTDYFRK